MIARQLLMVLLACDLLSCTGGRQDRSAAPRPAGAALAVATLGGQPIPYATFERYLADNAGDEIGGEQEDTIKSRMLDQFLEEQLLLGAAGDLKIAISEEEVNGYLKEIGVTEGEAEMASPEGKEAFRDKVRQGLILQKVKDVAVLSKVQVAPGEVEDYLKREPELLHQARMVVLRQILVDDRRLAERLRETLAAEPERFEAVAREHSVAPDRGQARTYSEEDLPLELKEPLFALEAGQISPVLENAQRYLIFQLVRKIEPRQLDREEIRRQVRLQIFQQKVDQVLERYLADLKSKTEIRINRAVLPFRYVGEHQ